MAHGVTAEVIRALAVGLSALARELPVATTTFAVVPRPEEYSLTVRLSSSKPGTCPIRVYAEEWDILHLEFGRHGNIEVVTGVGRGRRDYVAEVLAGCRAIVEGRVRETVWRRPDGRFLASCSVVELPDGDVSSGIGSPPRRGKPTVEVIQYERYAP